MIDAAALGYLEWRQTINRLKQIARSPGRLVFYAVIIVYFVGMARLRANRMHVVLLHEPIASAAFFAFVTLLGIIAYGAVSGFSGAFSSAAEARFLVNSKLDARTVVLWLQARRVWLVCIRMLVSVLFYTVLIGFSRNIVGFGLTVLGVSAACAAIAVPAMKMRQSIGTRLAHAAAAGLATFGIVPMVAALSRALMPNAAANGIAGLGFGTFANACLSGDWRALLALWGFAFALLAAAFAVGNDLYPELYVSSLRALDFRKRARRGRDQTHAKYEPGKRSGGAYRALSSLRGSWAIAWKEWIAFTRSPGARGMFVFTLCACALGGYVLASFALRERNPLVASLEFTPALYFGFLIFIAMGSAMNLGADVGKPLWWLGRTPLRERLFAWMFSRSWRMSACVFVCLSVWASVIHRPDFVPYAIPLSLLLVLHLSSVGLVLYSLFPASLDQRGPMGLVRVLITYTLAAPPLIAAILLAVFTQNYAIAALTATAITCVEIYAMLLFAAWRIMGSGASYAQAEGT